MWSPRLPMGTPPPARAATLFLLVVLLVTTAAGDSCSDRTSCAACVTKADITNYECHWCSKDSKCHAIGSLVSPCVVASSACVSLSKLSTCGHKTTEQCPPSDAAPDQVHIALAGSGSVAVSWFTARQAASVVQFGLSAADLNLNATGSSRQYLANHGWHHRVELTGLAPGTTFSYRVGDGDRQWGRTFRFQTLVEDAAATVALGVVGDLGWENSSARPMLLSVDGLHKSWSATETRNTMLGLVEAGTIDAVWHLGDIGYADDGFAHAPGSFTYEEASNGYMAWVEPIAARVPYMVSVGNHESECHSPACLANMQTWGRPLANFSAYNARWAMPHRQSGGAANMWYSFDIGAAHVVSLNSETDWPGAEEESTGDSHHESLPAGSFGGSGQYLSWLESDLRAANASRNATRPWVIVGGHRPFEELQATHGHLLERYAVDAYFSGHVHSYSRSVHTFPTSGHRMLTVLAGGAGCDEMAQAPASDARGHGQPSFSTGRYSVGVLLVNSSALTWTLYDSATGAALDEVVWS